MKVSSKPLSSPGRTEKFPPPLMRFLRTSVGSKSSRGSSRSRSSPMFVRKKNAAANETQEPTSPKVTCIGQVRVRRSSKKAGRSRAPSKRRRCWWVRKTLSCTQSLKPRSLPTFRPILRKWLLFFRFGYCRKVSTSDDSSKLATHQRGNYKGSETEEVEYGDVEVDEEEESLDKEVPGVNVSSTPPKNAFLLTRCRSAPYRSSSLACRFWGSPLGNQETGEDGNFTGKGVENQQEERETEKPSSENEPNCRNSMEEPGTKQDNEGNLGIPNQFEGPVKENIPELKATVLTRCKSEPARTGERLNPEVHKVNCD
ncbi:hypothetical protein RJ640_007217 [Escallonia rubra]|uniref:Protamine P1 family protein n=1 Tax=Escallonia rubra TaxID=112253 RepID=A0AA88UD23_9ASTE|nr:hypothetical protein RJ640_007217 [Escallonia rubra]